MVIRYKGGVPLIGSPISTLRTHPPYRRPYFKYLMVDFIPTFYLSLELIYGNAILKGFRILETKYCISIL